MSRARLTASATFASTTAAILPQASARIVDSDPGAVELSVTFDGSAPVILPRLQLDDGNGGLLPGITPTYPSVVPGWTVNGADPGAILEGDLEVGSDIDACGRSWKRPVVASTGTRRHGDVVETPLGYEITRGGPPPGRKVPVSFFVDLYGRGALAGTDAQLPLLTGGYVEQSKRGWDKSSHIMELSGSGPEALYRDREVDLVLDAGHGLTQGELVILVLTAAGVPEELIGVDPGLGSPRSVAIEERCVAAWPLIHDILRPIGYVVMAGRSDGIFREVSLDWAEEAAVTLLPAFEVAEIPDIEADAAAPSCAVVSGRRLDTLAPGPGSGTVTAEIVIETYQDGFAPALAVASQATGASTIVPTGATPTLRDGVLTSRLTIQVTTVDGCEDLTYVKEEGYFNPAAARYVAANTADGEPRTYPGHNVWFFGSIPSADDTAEGKLWKIDRWGIISETWTRPVWRSDGRRTGTTTKKSGWKNPLASIKDRGGPSDAWDAEFFTAGRNMLADFATGVLFDSERYFAGPKAPDNTFPGGAIPPHPGTAVNRHLEVIVEELEVDDCDLIPRQDVTTTAYGLRKGSTQLYPGGEASTDTEVGLDSSTFELRSVIAGKPTAFAGGTDNQGKRLETQKTTGDRGGIPAAEICTPATAEKDREETFSVTVCVIQHGEEDERKPIPLESIWVESEAEAEAYGRRELSYLLGYPVTLKLSWPVPIIDAGDTVAIDAPELGLPSTRMLKVWEEETKFGGGAGGTVEQVLKCKVKPWS